MTKHTFWEIYNSSRCKTTMMVISIIVTIAFALTEIFQVPNEDLKVVMVGIIGYWAGRTTKNKDKN